MSSPLKPIIAPSILAADFANLGAECKSVLSAENGAAEWLHFDIMDGHFVPNIALGPGIVESMRPALGPDAFIDVHLMVSHPGQWFPAFAKAGASQLTFHIEATQEPEAVAAIARKHGCRAGVALKPGTPAESVFELCDKGLVDMILVMTVEPGFGGQKFMVDMMPKVAALRKRYPSMDIQVDGGLGLSTIDEAAKAGANVIVAGTSVFKAPSRKEAIDGLRNSVQKALDAAAATA